MNLKMEMQQLRFYLIIKQTSCKAISPVRSSIDPFSTIIFLNTSDDEQNNSDCAINDLDICACDTNAFGTE
jgi:hypothetical protein